ncbi:hypothetical protein I4641_00775 [Waterburya agarophytonicola K14]|uniref:Uncharacterized protein n=1 Tax=Waterburya agarophytonicola KI4 TaxID=2874699 RepID=A0A964FF75_9CYAN|nr:hypothetical protein [Waterburya agarophytonicola]MCC0175514.1 hypothetical protein [Waterburya agarophytonicola KI4]
MRLQTSTENVSSVDKALGFTLAAFSMFVFGYTATRAFLSQPQTVIPANADIVIPHEATLWGDLGN